jgi:hypothetical protein
MDGGRERASLSTTRQPPVTLAIDRRWPRRSWLGRQPRSTPMVKNCLMHISRPRYARGTQRLRRRPLLLVQACFLFGHGTARCERRAGRSLALKPSSLLRAARRPVPRSCRPAVPVKGARCRPPAMVSRLDHPRPGWPGTLSRFASFHRRGILAPLQARARMGAMRLSLCRIARLGCGTVDTLASAGTAGPCARERVGDWNGHRCSSRKSPWRRTPRRICLRGAEPHARACS